RLARLRDERIEACEPLRARPEGLDREARALTDREQSLDARLLRVATDLRVQLIGAVAELAHLAEHQPAHAAERAECIETCFERAGIGVVRVVDQERAVQRRLQFET